MKCRHFFSFFFLGLNIYSLLNNLLLYNNLSSPGGPCLFTNSFVHGTNQSSTLLKCEGGGGSISYLNMLQLKILVRYWRDIMFMYSCIYLTFKIICFTINVKTNQRRLPCVCVLYILQGKLTASAVGSIVGMCVIHFTG